MTRILAIIASFIPFICFSQTNNLVEETRTRTCSVEVLPDIFIEYKEHCVLWELEHTSFAAVHAMPMEKEKFYQKNTTYLSIPWKKQEITWVGVGIPISIRIHKDILYMIVFDRDSNIHKTRFRYFKQNHNVLSEIKADDYPNEIATQNLWLRKESANRKGNLVIIDGIEIAKVLNPDDIDFQSSLTAKIWYQLEKKKEYYEIDYSVDPKFLKKYKSKHRVQKLKQIVK